MIRFLTVLFSTILLSQQSLAATPAQCTEEIGRGTASWYGPGFEGAKTKSGELFHPAMLSAAHPSLPFGTVVKVTNLRNARSINVRINDRGAFNKSVIDVSEGAAYELGMVKEGIAPVALFICNK